MNILRVESFKRFQGLYKVNFLIQPDKGLSTIETGWIETEEELTEGEMIRIFTEQKSGIDDGMSESDPTS